MPICFRDSAIGRSSWVSAIRTTLTQVVDLLVDKPWFGSDQRNLLMSEEKPIKNRLLDPLESQFYSQNRGSKRWLDKSKQHLKRARTAWKSHSSNKVGPLKSQVRIRTSV